MEVLFLNIRQNICTNLYLAKLRIKKVVANFLKSKFFVNKLKIYILFFLNCTDADITIANFTENIFDRICFKNYHFQGIGIADSTEPNQNLTLVFMPNPYFTVRSY